MSVHYTPDVTGFVVWKMHSGSDHRAYWYGPDSGWGTTYGPLDYSVRVFATEAGARLRLPAGCRVTSVDEARAVEGDA